VPKTSRFLGQNKSIFPNQLVPSDVFKEGKWDAKNTGREGRFQIRENSMRRLDNYVKKYGPDAGPKLFHALQSQAAHAGVSARLRRKIDVLTGKATTSSKPEASTLPLFPEPENAELMAVSA
jgi:hypothetical protein